MTLAAKSTTRTSSMELIPSGMVLDVADSVAAVPGTLHHGS